MRIGMILDKPFPPDPRVENEAISLIENGHEVYLFCLKYGEEINEETIKKIKVRRFHSTKLNYKFSALAYTFPYYTNTMAKKISHFIVTNKIEVVHIHDIQIAGAAFKATKHSKLPVVLDLHENRPEIIKFYPHLQKFPGKYLISSKKWKQKEVTFIKKSSKVIVVTEESKNEIIDRVGVDTTKVVVVPNTVHKKYNVNPTFNEGVLKKYAKNFVLLYIGDTGIRRGLQTAIESVSLLKNKIESLKLVIVGSNSTDAVLKKQVEELGIQDYVEFEGWQIDTTFPSYIKASSVCISPLHKNLHHDTTYANKIFQYMSFEKPLLVSDVLAQENIVNRAQSGLIHEAKNSMDFTDKVMELYEDDKLRTSLGVNGKQFIENEFYWGKTSKELIELYRNLAE